MAWGSSTGQSRFFIFAQTPDGKRLTLSSVDDGIVLKDGYGG